MISPGPMAARSSACINPEKEVIRPCPTWAYRRFPTMVAKKELRTRVAISVS